MPDPVTARIVIADDDDDIRRLVAFTLTRRGHTIFEANTGERALNLVTELEPDLVVLDVMMPGMSGIDVTRHIRTIPAIRHVPVLLVSAMGQTSEIEGGIESGATDYLVKPFKPRDLADKVQQLLIAAGGNHDD